MKTIPSNIKKAAAKAVAQLVKPCYFPRVPISDILKAVETSAGLVALQEDNTQWEGFICGSEGHMCFRLAAKESLCNGFYTPSRNAGLSVSWHKMNSGNYEIVAYVA